MPKRCARPTNDAQRGVVIDASEYLLEQEALESTVRTILEGLFGKVQGPYTEARKGYHVARAREFNARNQAKRAHQLFSATFRRWNLSVQDERGCRVPGEIAQELGGNRPGRLLQLPY